MVETRSSARFYVVGFAVLLGMYVLVTKQFLPHLGQAVHQTTAITVQDSQRTVARPNVANAGDSVTASPASAASVKVAGNVPEAIVQGIANQLGTVSGLDELVVMSAVNGAGYTVSATVDLGQNTSENASVWRTSVQSDVSRYFQGVFAKQLNVENAQVYFTLGGNVVAGAGLGTSAYQTLTTSVSTTSESMSQAIAQLPVVSQDGANDSWFEEQTP